MATENSTTYYPPVVAVLGHVDHGKTTLLDAIRQSSIAEREHGGITQKIGASSVEILHDEVKRQITFIDTPGHEAFTKMRSRGAQAADICLLIISSIDGIMPQTRESIQLLKTSGLPFIVVLTMSDLPTKNPTKVKQQLLSENILLEGMGGDVPVIEVSAKTQTNIKELLDLILLVQQMSENDHPTTAKPDADLRAIIIESKLDSKSGPRATVIIKDGTLRVRDDVFSENGSFRVRSLVTDDGKQVSEVTIGQAAEVSGFSTVPSVGSIISKNIHEAIQDAQKIQASLTLEEAFAARKVGDELTMILVADTEGSLEAIIQALPKKANIITQKTGEIAEADVLMAKSTGALIIGFGIKIRPEVAKFARTEKVLMKNYTIIYELLDEISEVLEGKALAMIEQIYGTARVLAKFPFEKTFALGIQVLDGRIARGDKARIMRGDEVIGETQINSLRVGKNPISKIEKGNEAGIIISPLLDFQVGDVVISHE